MPKISSQDRILQRTVEETLDESVVAVRSVPRERVQQRIDKQTVELPIPQLMEDCVEGSKNAPKHHLSDRICDRTVDISVPHVDVQDMVRFTPEIQKLRERSAMMIAGATVPPEKKDIAKVRQLLIKMTQYCTVFDDEVIFPWPVVELSTIAHDEFMLLCPALLTRVAHPQRRKKGVTKKTDARERD